MFLLFDSLLPSPHPLLLLDDKVFLFFLMRVAAEGRGTKGGGGSMCGELTEANTGFSEDGLNAAPDEPLSQA